MDLEIGFVRKEWHDSPSRIVISKKRLGESFYSGFLTKPSILRPGRLSFPVSLSGIERRSNSVNFPCAALQHGLNPIVTSSQFADCWFLTGATAVGKTRVGIALAKRLGAEIISLDSMAVYRGMDIGTAKPTPDDQAQIPHHLVDIVDPDQPFSIAQYLDAAQAKVIEVRSRGREVLFVGGTPLYLKCLLRGLFEGPPANWPLREEIRQEIAEVGIMAGNQALHSRLENVDPVAASQIHPNDTRRLIRALEVYRATGQPISHQQLQFDEGLPADQCRVFVLRRSREDQHQRINMRVDKMIARGLVEEVGQLTADGRQLGRTASQAVGYREVLDYLAGQSDQETPLDQETQLHQETMIEKIKTRTRRFAKRQGTWFRSLSECRFVDVAGEMEVEEIAESIVRVEG